MRISSHTLALNSFAFSGFWTDHAEEATADNPGDEVARSREQLFHQAPIFGEKQNIAHELPDTLRGRYLFDAVLRTLL